MWQRDQPRATDHGRAPRLRVGMILVLVCLVACRTPADDPQQLDEPENAVSPEPWPEREFIRVATFNIQELNRAKLFERDETGAGTNPQVRAAATIIQRVQPDILVLNELDHYYGQGRRGVSAYAHRFIEIYLKTGEAPLDYPFVLIAPNNTGILSGIDLNSDGVTATAADVGSREHGDDSFGFGTYPGQYSMVVLSRFPMDAARSRTFRSFLWKDLPGHHMPPGFYSDQAEAVFRLSSKSHMDFPVMTPGGPLHLWVSHPTPPAFDGDEDRNGRRNFDEIRFWRLYLDGAPELYDDQGRHGGFAQSAPFIVAGDLNAQPGTDESRYDGQAAIDQLLEHPRITDPGDITSSEGALLGRPSGGPTFQERATAEFSGGVRVDYVLPSSDLQVVGGGVFWPSAETDLEAATLADEASDHRMVWIDVVLPTSPAPGA